MPPCLNETSSSGVSILASVANSVTLPSGAVARTVTKLRGLTQSATPIS